MSGVTYPGYQQLGRVLTQDDIGKDVIRTFPYTTGAYLNFGFMTTDVNKTDHAAAKLTSLSAVAVIVQNDKSEYLMPNDGHWLTLNEFRIKVETAVAEILYVDSKSASEIDHNQ